MHYIVENYVNDLILKTKIHDAHLESLSKILDWLLDYNIRLNLKKCIFMILSVKFLGFIVSKMGIEVDPNTFKSINDMPPP